MTTPFPNDYYIGLSGTELTKATKRTLIHEIGHALCLGHCYCNTSSVMISEQYNGYYYTPQSHDIVEVNSKYS
jgi:predicted Zn-dependent protease